MSQVNVNIDKATVTAIHRFRSFRGEGIDFYVEAKSSNCTVYLQIVLYDGDARSALVNSIHEGDNVRVTGDLKVKSYLKLDGTPACSLIIERPVVFTKIVTGNSGQQYQHFQTDYREDHAETAGRTSNMKLEKDDVPDESEFPF